MITNRINRTEVTRFIFAGFINTVGSYLIYFVCLMFMNYILAYVTSIGLALIYSFYVNTKYVFKIDTNRKSFVIFAFILACQISFGIVLIRLWVEYFSIPKIIAPWLNILVLTPIMYRVSKFASYCIRKN